MKKATIKKLKKAILLSRSVLLDRTLNPHERGNTCEAFNSLINALQEATKWEAKLSQFVWVARFSKGCDKKHETI